MQVLQQITPWIPLAQAFISLVGAFLKFLAGTVIASRSAQRRDDRLRRQRAQALALALRAEIIDSISTAARFKDILGDSTVDAPGDDRRFSMMAAMQLTTMAYFSNAVFLNSISNLGLLGNDLSQNVVGFYCCVERGRNRLEFVLANVGEERSLSREKLLTRFRLPESYGHGDKVLHSIAVDVFQMIENRGAPLQKDLASFAA